MKLCAYTICKNEIKHVETWIKGLIKETDYICVLDTGSTDGTYEALLKFSEKEPKIIVAQKKIEPWRFDDARNEAKKLIPDCVNVAMTVDLDEVYRPGFREAIEEDFKAGYNLISGYKLTYKNNQLIADMGEELSLPIISDIKNWKWVYPVHEYPQYYDETKVKETVDFRIVCEHRPDETKSRKQYAEILKKWYESSDTPDAICVEKYSVELYQRGDEAGCYKILCESIDKCKNTNTVTGKDTLYRNALNMAILYRNHKENDKIKKYIEMAKSSGLKTRALYAFEAEVEGGIFEDYNAAANALLEALKITEINSKPYIENVNLFISGEIEKNLAFYLYKLKKYDDAFKFIQMALELDPDNEDYKIDRDFYERLSTNKICVYTICRNESKFVEKWVENNKDADHLVALVHDCTDDTREKLIAGGVDVGYGFYNEWRFDNGKNDSMHLAYALAPECNIFVFTSLDEYWEPGWAEEVKKNWIPGVTQQCWYNFVQSHDEFGNDTGVSYFNWMISKDPKWHWEYPIHEAIIYGKNEPVNIINLFNTVKLQHRPDVGKPRNYLDLHKLRYEEYKDDISCLYMIREYIIRNKLNEAYELASKFDHEHTDLCAEENGYIYTMAGICCEYLHKSEEALENYEKALAVDPGMRTPLVRAGGLCVTLGLFQKGKDYIQRALDTTTKRNSWLEDPNDWRSKPFYLLSYISLKINREEEAIGYALFASQIDPTDLNKKQLQDALDSYYGK